MSTVAIIGATGVVGSRVLEQLLARADVDRVVALGRRLPALRHDKLSARVADLQSATGMAAELPDAVSIAISALGTTIKSAGSQAAFRAVDHDAVLAFASAAQTRGARRFLLVSALGANARSGNFYLRTKGQAEDALARLAFSQLTVLRPSLIDDQGQRPEQRLGERLALPLSRALFSVIGRTHRYAPIAADVIARALLRLAFDASTERLRIIESDQLHVLAR
jgi:uncharacterized protein YbjT (DUF2867 family)